MRRLGLLGLAPLLAAQLARGQPTGPELIVPEGVRATAGGSVAVPVQFAGHGSAVAAAVFSVDFDQGCLGFDPADEDAGGIPDAVSLSLPPGFGGSAGYDPNDLDGELDVFVADTFPPLGSLPDGTLAAITFTALCQPPPGGSVLAPVGFSGDPPASFGGTSGEGVPGSTSDGWVEIVPAATPTPEGPRATLSIPAGIAAVSGSPAAVPIAFAGNGHDVAAAVFAVDFDQACLSFDPTDEDADDIPDAVSLSLPPGFDASVTYDADDTDAEIDVFVADTFPPLSALPDATLGTVTFTAACEPGSGNTVLARVGFSQDPAASFGDTGGRSVPGASVDGSVLISSSITPSPTATPSPTLPAAATSTATATATTQAATATATATAPATPTRTPTPRAAGPPPRGGPALLSLALLCCAVLGLLRRRLS